MNMSQEERDKDALARSSVYVNVNKEIAIRVQELIKLLQMSSALDNSGFGVGISSDHTQTIEQIRAISNDVQHTMMSLISSQDTQEPMKKAVQIARAALEHTDPVVRAFAEGVETRLCRANNTLNPTAPMMSSTDKRIEELQKVLEDLRGKVEAQSLTEGENEENKVAVEIGKIERKVERIKEEPFANSDTFTSAKKATTSGLDSIKRSESFKGFSAKLKEWFANAAKKIMEIGQKLPGMAQHLLSQHDKVQKYQDANKNSESNVDKIAEAKDEVRNISKTPGAR